MTETMQGVVPWFHSSRGYGLIGRDAAEDVFVHYSALEVGEGATQWTAGGICAGAEFQRFTSDEGVLCLIQADTAVWDRAQLTRKGE